MQETANRLQIILIFLEQV